MDDNISRYYYELSEAKNERNTKRLFVAFSLIITLLLAIILALSIMLYKQTEKWADFVSSYDYSGEEIMIDSREGDANFIGRDGSIINGEN